MKKLSFGFTDEDDVLLGRLKGKLREQHGSLTNIAVIRISLRAMDRSIPDSLETSPTVTERERQAL